MNYVFWAMWGAVGWCGTPWRRWPPKPEPDPWWWRVLGVVGGILGGWAFTSAFPGGNDIAMNAVLSSVGALAGSIIVQDIAGMAMGKSR